MLTLLERLGIDVGSDLHGVLREASRINAEWRGPSAVVGRTMLLNVIIRMNSSVHEVMRQSGFVVDRWDRSITPAKRRPPAKSRAIVDVRVEEATMIKTLAWYRERWPGRPLDSTGLAAAILATASSIVEGHLIASGVDVPLAANALERLVDGSASHEPQQPDFKELALSAGVSALLDGATRLAAHRDRGFTPGMVMAAILLRESHTPDTAAALIAERVLQQAPAAQESIARWLAGTGDTGAEPVGPLLRAAEQIARKVSDSPLVRGRHLVAALLTTSAETAQLLQQIGVPADSLAVDLLNYLEEKRTLVRDSDYLDEWQTILGTVEPHTVPTYDAESTDSDDLLGTMALDVRGFATLIASKELKPPLSVGLFGNWGSGKSFFMARLRRKIRELSARNDDSFRKRVVQIEFNAWHYVEANLWASLVEHIFRNLRLAGEPQETAEARQKVVLEKLDHAIADQLQAEKKVEEAQLARNVAEKTLEAKRVELEVAASKLNRARVRDAWELLKDDDELRDVLNTALARTGLRPAVETIDKVRATVAELRGTGLRTRALLSWATSHKKPWLWLFAVVVGAPLIAGILGAWLRLLPSLEAFSAAVLQVATLVSGVLAWIGIQLRRAKPVLDSLESARLAVERKINQAEEQLRQDVEKEAEDLAAKETALADAKSAVEQATGKVREAQQELLDLRAHRRLARFIDQRAASDDYRKLLGVLATVRTDFEMLSALMEDQARESATVQPIDQQYRVDRIVLYIDDLDRCPPARVVEVLQAVHLLLAFRLFVVVVGVDARWVTESLRQRHRDLWQGDGSTVLPGHAATPDDYLEKIFQVPFWLEPLDEGATRRFVRRLLENDVKKAATNPLPGAGTANGSGSAVAQVETGAAEADLQELEEETPDTTVDNRRRLELQQAELDAMVALAPLIGRSPRTVKRYVNTYRIIRSAIPKRRLERFLAESHVPQYKAVLLLLGVVVGTQKIAFDVFRVIEKNGATRLADLRLEQGDDSDWRKVDAAFQSFASTLDGTCAELLPHIRTVSRYSFHAREHAAS